MVVNSVVNMYTDGSSVQNPGPSGFAYIIQYTEEENGEKNDTTIEFSKGYKRSTNSRMEMMAIVEGMKCVAENIQNNVDWNRVRQLNIFTDSEFCANSINKNWLGKWQENGWMTSGFGGKEPHKVKNIDLWEDFLHYQSILRSISVNMAITWVKGHADNEMNNKVDRLARNAAEHAYEEGEIDSAYDRRN